MKMRKLKDAYNNAGAKIKGGVKGACYVGAATAATSFFVGGPFAAMIATPIGAAVGAVAGFKNAKK